MKLLLVFVLAAAALAQDTPAAQPHRHLPGDLISSMKLRNSAPAVWLAASLADATTDWQFQGPITGRTYKLTPGQQVTLATGVVGVGLAVRHIWPKTAPTVNYIFSLMAGVRAYRSYANAGRH